MTENKNFDKVLEILFSESRDLNYLANLSGEDAFTFYRGADLSGLDLSGLDLRGLNFDNANFRSSNLIDIKFDIGAFSACNLPDAFRTLSDDFDGYLTDIFIPQMRRVHIFASLRSASIERVFALLDVSYKYVAEVSGLNLGTLRKARRSNIISASTLRSISETIAIISNSKAVKLENFPSAKQPMVKYFSIRPTGEFNHIKRKDLLDLLPVSILVDGAEKEATSEGKFYVKRTPDSLRWLRDFFGDFEGDPPFFTSSS